MPRRSPPAGIPWRRAGVVRLHDGRAAQGCVPTAPVRCGRCDAVIGPGSLCTRRAVGVRGPAWGAGTRADPRRLWFVCWACAPFSAGAVAIVRASA